MAGLSKGIYLVTAYYSRATGGTVAFISIGESINVLATVNGNPPTVSGSTLTILTEGYYSIASVLLLCKGR